MLAAFALVATLMVSEIGGRTYEECEFPNPNCGWSWSERWNLITAENLTSLGQTAPKEDSKKNVKGQFLYWTADESGREDRLEIESPLFKAHTLPTCTLEMSLHMWQMDLARFVVVITASNNTWESTHFEGTSDHEWQEKTQRIGLLSQPFRVMLEIKNESPAFPSHVAIDDIHLDGCYEKKLHTTDCEPRQFQCLDLMCIESNEVCDITPHCTLGEDEEQECDKIPDSGYCNFENGMCGWFSNDTLGGKWVLRQSPPGTDRRSGPAVDHTYRNKTGTFLVSVFRPGRTFGESAIFTSPWFPAPPYYHRNVHSAYFNSCQILLSKPILKAEQL